MEVEERVAARVVAARVAAARVVVARAAAATVGVREVVATVVVREVVVMVAVTGKSRARTQRRCKGPPSSAYHASRTPKRRA
jgi:hypothetical protein